MAGWCPNQGEQAFLNVALDGTTRTANLQIGLWAGTASADETVTYTQADAVFTKVAATGLTEKTLTDGSWTIATDGSNVTTATYADQVFTAGAAVSSEAVNGYYVAITEGAVKKILFMERDPVARSLNEGESYTIGLSLTAE